MQNPGIYKIQSIIKPNYCYIGSAINIKNRWYQHKYDLRNNKHHSLKLQNHYNKYKESDLIFIILEPCLPDFLIIREQYYINKLNPFFNNSLVAGSSMMGRNHTVETKKKISKANKGHIVTKKARQKISESHKGNIPWNKGLTKHTNKIIKRISEKNNGKKRSIEVRRKMSKRQVGRIVSEETKAKHRNQIPWNKGKCHTLEARRKMTIASLEKWKNPEYKKRMSIVHTGIKQSEETKQKKRDSMIGMKMPERTIEIRRNMSIAASKRWKENRIA